MPPTKYDDKIPKKKRSYQVLSANAFDMISLKYTWLKLPHYGTNLPAVHILARPLIKKRSMKPKSLRVQNPTQSYSDSQITPGDLQSQ